MVDITPSPRILIILGTVEIEPWACIAELVDNSLDGYLGSQRTEWMEKYGNDMSIKVSLPSKEELAAGNGEIVVEDSGPGMSPEMLNNAVRAGWSGKSGYDRLGLFGIGFNVATAKLGNKTKISTARVEDDSRYWIEIDPFAMQDHAEEVPDEAWEAPDGFESKEMKYVDQGTRVIISDLNAEEVERLLVQANNKANLKRRLSRIYSPLLENHPVSIRIVKKNSKKRDTSESVVGWKHCVWSEKRTVKYKKVEEKSTGLTPAKVPLSIPLKSQYFCKNCWLWFKVGEEPKTCSRCGSEKIDRRTREITGWLGVQRGFFGQANNPQNHYGIDLVRNGRVIEEVNKDFFSFEESDGNDRVDYPVEGNYSGRIVGSIDISFCPTDFRKRKFERNDPNWVEMAYEIRGNGIRRKKVEEDGKEFIETALVTLIRAFGSDKMAGKRKPGMDSLVAGKVKMNKGKPVLDSNGLPYLQSDFAKHRDYTTKFWEGKDPVYQTEDIWWEDIEWAESFDPETWLEEWNSKNSDGGGGGGGGKCKHGNVPSKCQKCKTHCEHNIPRDRCGICNPWEKPETWTLDEDLSRLYEISVNGRDLSLDVEVYCDELESNAKEPPLRIEATTRKMEFRAIYEKSHPMFTSFKEKPVDYLMILLADLARRANSHISLDDAYFYLKETYCKDQKINLGSVFNSCTKLIGDLKEFSMSLGIDGRDLSKELQGQVMKDIEINEHRGMDLFQSEMDDGSFIHRVRGDLFFEEILSDNIPRLLDGNFFDSKLEEISTSATRRSILNQYESYLRMVCFFEESWKLDHESLVAAKRATEFLQNRRVS